MVLWIFGYASLLWKAGFHYDERVVGFVKGYRRTFHLACFEHRGTPELPARVATLEEDGDAVCWGAAYCIKSPEAATRAMEYLHVRESEYDVIRGLQFFTESSPNKPVVAEVAVFMSTLESKYYLGAAPMDEMARQIATATGPSGPNCDYIFCLVEALREIGHEDAEVIELANAVKEFLSEAKANPGFGNHGVLLSSQLFTSPSHKLLTAVPVQTSTPLHAPLGGKVIG